MRESGQKRPDPMPKATVCLVCDECGNTITEVDLCTNYLAAVLFKARKEHAKKAHGWTEEPTVTNHQTPKSSAS